MNENINKKIPLIINLGNKLLLVSMLASTVYIFKLFYWVTNNKSIMFIDSYFKGMFPVFIMSVLWIIIICLYLGIHYLKKVFKISVEENEEGIINGEVLEKANYMSNLIYSAAFTYLIQQY